MVIIFRYFSKFWTLLANYVTVVEVRPTLSVIEM